ncbi:5,6-dimethylbenzimidazole synthase [uncultured Jatrophihabitans sp.]|uniref:5,6-dimethylbenzimidazole synthase n=1 Tax=uncultured Jatrophihabitans sp. TaxID=1610747 RepID=UPI0035CC2096
MSWPRPVATVGDRTSAAERAADPTGWAMPPDTAAALREVIAARRDVRRFRPDPVPAALLRQVLDAGHHAPSVGHSQPWRFVVVTEQATRERAAALADRERLRQAEQLDPDRRARLLDLQLEGLREAPLGIVVACDRRAPAAGVLGRATFADSDLWSCACAVQNIWLAARAVGLGVGWVTLFRPADLSALLGLPDGVDTLGWLCLGWPDERPPDPGLERRGWSRRLDLDDVVLRDRWPAADPPAPPPSHLAAPDQTAVVAGRDSGDELLAAPGSLGVLDAAVDRVLALPGPPPTTGALVLAAGDHPVVRHGVSAYPASVTADVLAATVAGESLAAATARAAGLRIVARHATATRPQGDLVSADALAAADVDALLAEGAEIGRAVAAHGLVCLGEVGIGNTTVAAALACALLDVDPDDVDDLVGLGAGADAAMLARKADVVRRALVRAREAHGEALSSPTTSLAAVGGPEFALLAGVVLGAADAGVPVVLDGLATSVAALVAVRLEPAARAYLVAGQRSRERGHGLVLAELGLEPLLDLRLRAGEGVGACLAAQLLLSALAVRATAGRTR